MIWLVILAVVVAGIVITACRSSNKVYCPPFTRAEYPWERYRGSDAQQEEFLRRTNDLRDKWVEEHPEERTLVAHEPLAMITVLRAAMLEGYEPIGSTMSDKGIFFQAVRLKEGEKHAACIRLTANVAEDMGGWAEWFMFSDSPVFKTDNPQ